MSYTVHWTTPSGRDAEQHELGRRAAERAIMFSSMGASDVHVAVEGGRIYRIPDQVSDLLREAEAADAES